MADINNSPSATTRSQIPRPSRIPVPGHTIRQSPSNDFLRNSTASLPASRLRPALSRDQLAPKRTSTIAPRSRDSTTGGVIYDPSKAPTPSKSSNENLFRKSLTRQPSFQQEQAQVVQRNIENGLGKEFQSGDVEGPGFGSMKIRKARPSLSERAVETLSSLPPSPAVPRRESNFFNPESPMRPPSRATNGSRPSSRVGSRPGSGYQNDSMMRPPSRQTNSRPGSSMGHAGQAIPIDFRASTNTFKPPPSLNTPKRPSTVSTLKTPRSVSNLRLAASTFKTPSSVLERDTPAIPSKDPSGTPMLKSGSKTVGRTVKPRASVGGLFKKPSMPEMNKSFDDIRPRQALKKVSPTFSNASTGSSSATSWNSKESVSIIDSSPSQDTSPNKSSSALRDQIAKAKTAKRAAAAKQVASHDAGFSEQAPVIPTGTFDFGLDADPFNQQGNEDPNKGLLRKRIDSARTDGRLNIAAMGLKEIPDEVMNMYNLENMSGGGSWAECVDLSRFIAADNELEVIGDDIFPDVDPRDQMDDEYLRGNQFGGLETLDLHGNVLTSVPRGLRRLELLTTLNLSNNKLGNDCLEVISKIATLRDLKIANNGLSGELDSGLSNLCNLEVLDIQKNQLTSLPEGLVDLVRLRILNLSGNAFKSLPFETLRRLPLTELSAANNKLSGVLISFDNVELAALKELDITGNSVTSLSSGMLSLPALHTLTCSANRLTSLPDITTWTSLLTITAEDNSISDIPDGLVSLTKLKSVDFNGNNIKLIPDQLALMDSLEYFRISGNPLREKKFSGMNTADLKRALLARIRPATPERVPKFETNLDESESEYLDAPSSLPRSPTSWPVSAMGVLDRSSTISFTLNPVTAAQVASSNMVKTVELHHNTFTEIPASIAFFGLTLTSLSLSHNELTSDTFLKDELDLPVLRELNLSSNTFNSLQPLIRYLNAPQLTNLDISFNRLTSLPALRPAFPNLVVVLASNNAVRELYPDAVRGLKILDLQDNEINSLNAKLGLITGLQRLEVKGNRFRVPKWTVLEKGTEYVLGWLRDKIPAGELEGDGLGQGSVQDIGETF